MSKAKFTKGPWRYAENTVEDSNGQLIAALYVSEEARYNGELMAAAPELYADLKHQGERLKHILYALADWQACEIGERECLEIIKSIFTEEELADWHDVRIGGTTLAKARGEHE